MYWLSRKPTLAMGYTAHHPKQVEALRTWAACAAYGIHILSLDDAYPALCARLSPPSDWEAFSAGGGAPSPGAHLRLAVMADAHRAAAALMARARCASDYTLLLPILQIWYLASE